MAKKIIGYRRNCFSTKENVEIKGYDVYLAEEGKEGVTGIATSNFYLTDAKVESFNLDLEDALGKTVYIRYNSYGKPSVVRVMEDK